MNYTDPSGHKSTKLKDWKKIRKYTMTKEAKKALEDYTIAGLIKLFDKSGVFLKYLAKGASKYLAAKAFYKKLKYKPNKNKKTYYIITTVYGYKYVENCYGYKHQLGDINRKPVGKSVSYSTIEIKGK